MKQRKLFAILTLVAFMMTLLPMAAFAAPVANVYASGFDINRTTQSVGSTGVKLTVNAADVVGANVYAADTAREVIFVTDRTGADTVAIWSGSTKGTDGTVAGVSFYTSTNAANEGLLEARLTSAIAGKVKVAAAFVDDAYPIVNGSIADVTNHAEAVRAFLNGASEYNGESINKNNLNIIDVHEVTFTSAAAGHVQLLPGTATRANGLDQMEITAVVRTGSVVGQGTPVANEEVTFSVNKSGLSFDKATYKTDSFGRVTAKVTATKSGVYRITANAAGETSAPQDYTFTADTTPFTLEFTRQPAKTLAEGVLAENEWRVRINDVSGNRIQRAIDAAGQATDNGDIIFRDMELVRKPEDSNAADPTPNGFDASGNYRFNFTPDKSGEYTLRFSLNNGRYIESTFQVAKQGKVTNLSISYDEKSIVIPANGVNNSGAPTVKQIDAAGVERTAQGNLQYSSSNPSVLAVNASTGALTTATTDADDAQVVTITVVDTTNNLIATTEMPLVGAPVALVATEPAEVEVNEKAKVELKFVDKNGNAVALGANPNNYDYTITSSPAGAGVDVTFAADRNADFRNKGISTVEISSTQAGKVTVMIRVEDANNQVYLAPVTLNVGVPASEKPGANKVTLFIGQQVAVVDGNASVLDVAPFIKDGRTFVPVRFIAEALGAEVKYDAATQVVTATRGDDVVEMTIGSNVMTVNGEAQVTDVAPFIVDGRTVLPFRALAEAFGSEVAWDAATQSVVFEK